VGAHVGEQVVDRLAQPDRIAHYHGGAIELTGHGTTRVGGGEIAGGLASQPHQVNRLFLQRPTLIGASQQEEIVHQSRHARAFRLDTAHGVTNRLRRRERTLAIELGVAA
jgi:hypothetical protein